MNDTLHSLSPQSPSVQSSPQQLSQEVALLQEMITLLVNYEKQCVQRLDLPGAKETRGRIQQLTEKEEEMRSQMVAMAQDQKAMEMSQQQQDLIQCFDRVWSQHLNELVASLAQAEQQLQQQQKSKRQELLDRFDQEKSSGFKPTTKLTNIKRKVVGLMKLHNYEEAQFESNKAKKLEQEQRKSWQTRVEQRRRNALQLFTRKSAKEFEVLRSKNQDILYGQMRERDEKFGILLKKHQVKRVEAIRSGRDMMQKSMSTTSLNTKRIQ